MASIQWNLQNCPTSTIMHLLLVAVIAVGGPSTRYSSYRLQEGTLLFTCEICCPERETTGKNSIGRDAESGVTGFRPASRNFRMILLRSMLAALSAHSRDQPAIDGRAWAKRPHLQRRAYILRLTRVKTEGENGNQHQPQGLHHRGLKLRAIKRRWLALNRGRRQLLMVERSQSPKRESRLLYSKSRTIACVIKRK